MSFYQTLQEQTRSARENALNPGYCPLQPGHGHS